MYSKELLKGTLPAIILKLMAERERMYGYEIYQCVKDLTAGKIILKDGSLYPALHKMTADGLLSYKEEYIGGRRRKYYYLTRKGKKVKKDYLEELRDFMSTINRVVFLELRMG